MVENQVANPVTVEQNISKPIHSEVADKETKSPNTPLNTPRRCQLLRHDHHGKKLPGSKYLKPNEHQSGNCIYLFMIRM